LRLSGVELVREPAGSRQRRRRRRQHRAPIFSVHPERAASEMGEEEEPRVL